MASRQNISLSDESPAQNGWRSKESAANDRNASTSRTEYAPGVPTVLDNMEADTIARRKLLKFAAYTVPIVLGTLIIPQAAAASSICIPNENCSPNDPYCNPK